MHKFLPWLTGFCLLLVVQAPVVAQNLRNDGFHRRNGQMHVLRNGQLRPMTRDVRLPTGAIVTKDGFVRAANGTRTELREGQGCDLKGNLVTVVPAAGGFALSSPTDRQRRAADSPTVVRAALEELLGRGSDDEHEREDEYKEYDKKRAERAREQRKKEEEWAREERKRQEEYNRERGKKWKEKWKKGKGWDD